MRGSPSAIDIRVACAVDAPTMSEIHAACFVRSWDVTAIAQLIGAPGSLSLIGSALPQQPPQGFLIVRSAAGEAEVLTLAVDPSARRLGLARALLAAAIAVLRQAGAKLLFLEVDEGNEAASNLYRSLGAVVVGRRKRYYERGADADIFSLAL